MKYSINEIKIKKFNIKMKGYNKCLSCENETKNKKYCSQKCKQKYYYHHKDGESEKKKEYVKNKRKKQFIDKIKEREMLLVNILKSNKN